MMEFIGWGLIGIGVLFFISGIVALLRFPDIYTRLHALTKADNLGLGFIVLGLSCHYGSWLIAVKLVLIWGLVMLASAAVSHLIANAALIHEREGG